MSPEGSFATMSGIRAGVDADALGIGLVGSRCSELVRKLILFWYLLTEQLSKRWHDSMVNK